MDASESDFVRIPDCDVKKLSLFETQMQQCGKKRAAEGGADEGVEEVMRAKEADWPVKLGRDEATEYWQSLIDAGRERGVMGEAKVDYTPANHLRSLKLKGKATKSLADNKAFVAAMHAKVNLFAQTKSAPKMGDLKFDCIHCDKTFTTRTSLGQHVAAKHAMKEQQGGTPSLVSDIYTNRRKAF